MQTKKVALYGPGVTRTIKGGTGSGEVNERHSVTILEGMENRGFEVTTRQWIEDYEEAYEEGGYEAGSSNFRAGVAELIIVESQQLLNELQ